MKNKEKFAKEIVDVACSGFPLAIINNKVCACNTSKCHKCDLSNDCIVELEKQAESEYIEYEIDWSKVPIDTPVIVKGIDHDYRHYFEKLLPNGRLSVFHDGRTSWSSSSYKERNRSYPVSSVTLAREEDKIKYRKVKEV